MISLNYKIENFEIAYQAPQGLFHSPVAIVDNELGNDISADWDYEKGKVVVTGILFKDTINIYIKEREDDNDFVKTVSRKLLNIGSETPIYAFNKAFEVGNFKGDFNLPIIIQEIKPFAAKGWNKDRFYQELINNKVIPDIKIKDILNGNGAKCIGRWQEYLRTGNFQNMMDIVSHNLSCLLKESVILKHFHYYKENWEIDSKGFMLKKKN